MGIVKLKSTMYVVQNQLKMYKSPAFDDHPSWTTGIQALEEFHEWVGTIVLPIAFAWIEEHWDQVYGAIDKLADDPENDKEQYYGDVGAVIAAAFQIVRETDYYKDGIQAGCDLKEGKEDTSELNLTWTRITTEIRKATEDIFRREKKYLDDTIIHPGSGDDVDRK
jgi:hypothetical protein